MKLSDLIKDMQIISVEGNSEAEVGNISYDTRTVDEKSVFVCIKGINTDRHDFIDSAVEKGCKVIISQYPVKKEGTTNVVVPDTNKALARISSNFYGNPEKKLRVIGVTGTNGKTTSTTLLKATLEESGYKVGLIGTNDIIIGDTVIPSPNTTPEAPELFEYFSKMVEEKCDFAIMEVSSHSVSLDRIYGIEFEVGVFTNLTQDHLDYHKTMENYAKAKSQFFSYCKNCVINEDDEYSAVMKENIKGKLITYSINKPSDYRAVNVKHMDDGVSYTVKKKNDSYDVTFPIPGNFSIYNSLVVCSVGGILGIPDTFVRMSLKNSKRVMGRCEIVPVDKPYKVIIDYAHTPDGMENILTTIREFKRGRLITLFGCGGDRDKGKRPKMGKMAEKYSDVIIVTSDNPRSEDMQAIIDDIMVGIERKDNVYTNIDRKEAIRMALNMAEENDIILLLGKGHETVQKFKDYNIEFDERKIVREICDLQ